MGVNLEHPVYASLMSALVKNAPLPVFRIKADRWSPET